MTEEYTRAAGPAVLFVDDEAAVLEGYQRLLHREFPVEVACGSKAALHTLEVRGPFAVIVADMRMPEMNGVELLKWVKTLSPDSVRMMLTGANDIGTAMEAVNAGSVFRFLTKPVRKETLVKALHAGLAQYRLVTAEKELLERTLSGTVKVLTDVLSLVNPAAFACALRLREYVHCMAARLGLQGAWRFEVAAMMSQLGCVILDPETIETVHAGRQLSPEEQTRYQAHPSVGRALLSSIPRLEAVAEIIGEQLGPVSSPAGPPADPGMREIVRMGSVLLRAALQFDRLLMAGVPRVRALAQLSADPEYGPTMIAALSQVDPVLDLDPGGQCRCLLEELTPGMIVDQEVRSASGMLILVQGQEINTTLLMRLENLRQKQALPATILVRVPTARNRVIG